MAIDFHDLYPSTEAALGIRKRAFEFLALTISPSSAETPNATPKGEHSHRSLWIILFSLSLAVILLYITLRSLDWETFWNTMKTGRYEIIFLVLPISSFNYFVRALRWNIFVRADKKVSILSVFWANMVGYLGNAYLPARAGELLRSAFLGRKSGLGTSFIFATALVERLLDVIVLVLIGSISLLSQRNIPPILESAVRIMALLGAAGLTIIIAAPFQERLILRVLVWLPLPKKFSGFVSGQVSRFLVGMRSLQNWHRLMTFILLTGAIWSVDALGTMIGVRIISQTLNIWQAFILLSALGLSSAIPSTPGYVGVYQFVAVAVLVPFGFSLSEALAYIIIAQILNYVMVSFWGLIGLWQMNRGKQSLLDPQETSPN